MAMGAKRSQGSGESLEGFQHVHSVAEVQDPQNMGRDTSLYIFKTLKELK